MIIQILSECDDNRKHCVIRNDEASSVKRIRAFGCANVWSVA